MKNGNIKNNKNGIHQKYLMLANVRLREYFGSLLDPFGSLLAAFGYILAPFGRFLAPLWMLLAPCCMHFLHLATLLVKFGINFRRWVFSNIIFIYSSAVTILPSIKYWEYFVVAINLSFPSASLILIFSFHFSFLVSITYFVFLVLFLWILSFQMHFLDFRVQLIDFSD